jgi:hypothetical protein
MQIALGVAILVYVVLVEGLDWIGRAEIIEKRWPRMWGVMNKRPTRLILILVAIGLLIHVIAENRHSVPDSPPVVNARPQTHPSVEPSDHTPTEQKAKPEVHARQGPSQKSALNIVVRGDVNQSTTGDCTANVIGGDANLNCDSTPPPRTIPPERYKQIRDYLAENPGTVIVSASGNSECYEFARFLYLLLKDAGWQMRDGAVRGTTVIGGPPLQGIIVKYRGTPLTLGERELITGLRPEDRIGNVLGALKLNPSVDRQPNYSDGVIEIEVGDQPRRSSINHRPRP